MQDQDHLHQYIDQKYIYFSFKSFIKNLFQQFEYYQNGSSQLRKFDFVLSLPKHMLKSFEINFIHAHEKFSYWATLSNENLR